MSNTRVYFVKNWYRYFLFGSIMYILMISAISAFIENRHFALVHIFACVGTVMASNYSYKIFRIFIKTWSVLLMLSGGLILLSTVMFMLSNSMQNASIEKNIIAVLSFAIGFVLFRYFDTSVSEKSI